MKRLFFAGCCILTFLCSPAAVITVTSTADTGAGSLRDAIASANSSDTIQFASTVIDSIQVSSELVIDKDLVIIGPGADLLQISGGGSTRVIYIRKGIQVYISGLTFIHGVGSTGGAILNEGAELTLEYSVIRNSHSFYGGGIANQTQRDTAGNNSILRMNYCRVLDNFVRGNRSEGGGIYNNGVNGDSAILEVNYCDILGNRVMDTQGGTGTGGGIQNVAPDNGFFGPGTAICRLNNSSISRNSVLSNTALGGGISSNVEGPIQGGTARLEMVNCTVSDNVCESPMQSGSAWGGGVYSFVVISSPIISTAEISNCTVTNNRTSAQNSSGGGMYFGASAPGLGTPELFLSHNIIAANITGSQATTQTDIDAELILNGHNLIGIGDRILTDGGGGISGTLANPLDPQLLPLAYNGGFTMTNALKAGSPAIDAGSVSLTLLTDQRDSARVGTPDIGAFEFNPNAVSLFSLSGQILQSNASPLQSTKVLLISYNPIDSSLSAVDSTQTDVAGNYSFSGLVNESFYLKALPDSAVYPLEMPTYYDGSLVFQGALSVNPGSVNTANFRTIFGFNPGGPGFIGGLITQGANKTPGDKLPGINLVLIDTLSKAVHGVVQSDSKGEFNFSNLALGTYAIWVDKPFIDNSLAPIFTLTSQDDKLENLKFELQKDKLEWVGVVDGIDISNLWDQGSYSLYPNPANEFIRFEWEANTFGEEVILHFFEPTGKLIKRISMLESGEINVPLRDLSAGMYLYSVSYQNEIKAIGKFVRR